MNKLIFVLFILISHSSTTYADALSIVEDIKLLEETQKQIQLIHDLKEDLNSKLLGLDKRLLESIHLMQGHYGYGTKFSNPTLNQWIKSGNNWDSLLNRTNPNDALSPIAAQIENDFPLRTGDSLFHGKHSEQTKLFDLLSKTTLASRASQTLTYNQMNTELSMLEALQNEIEETPNQKAALDLIARIQIETAKLAAFKMKMDAVNGQLVSLKHQEAISDTKWISDFFNWHE